MKAVFLMDLWLDIIALACKIQCFAIFAIFDRTKVCGVAFCSARWRRKVAWLQPIAHHLILVWVQAIRGTSWRPWTFEKNLVALQTPEAQDTKVVLQYCSGTTFNISIASSYCWHAFIPHPLEFQVFTAAPSFLNDSRRVALHHQRTLVIRLQVETNGCSTFMVQTAKLHIDSSFSL